MRFLLKVTIPNDRGRERISDPQFGQKMKELLGEIKAEAAYFTSVDKQRGAYIILNMDDVSQMPSLTEPLFIWLKADLEIFPVMTPQDLEKAGPAMGASVKKWS